MVRGVKVMERPVISCVICTHNRANYLKGALESVLNQSLSKRKYEVIVVDNASCDHTKSVVRKQSSNNIVRYIFEPELGLALARNTGFKNSRGQYVAYLDDDAFASNTWLEAIVNAFEKTTPKPACVGGWVEPVWDIPRPTWLPKEFESFLSIFEWFEQPRFLGVYENLFGTNIAFRKKDLLELGGFKYFLGRKGNNLMSAEETLLQEQLRAQGKGILYHPQIHVRHAVLRSRLTRRWFLKRVYAQGLSIAFAQNYGPPSVSPKMRWFRFKKVMDNFNPKNLIGKAVRLNESHLLWAGCAVALWGGYFVGRIKVLFGWGVVG